MRATFTQDKETKGTIRYRADDEDAAVAVVYVKKEAARTLGDRITVEIKPVD